MDRSGAEMIAKRKAGSFHKSHVQYNSYAVAAEILHRLKIPSYLLVVFPNLSFFSHVWTTATVGVKNADCWGKKKENSTHYMIWIIPSVCTNLSVSIYQKKLYFYLIDLYPVL